jgi:hypothetical protein
MGARRAAEVLRGAFDVSRGRAKYATIRERIVSAAISSRMMARYCSGLSPSGLAGMSSIMPQEPPPIMRTTSRSSPGTSDRISVESR